MDHYLTTYRKDYLWPNLPGTGANAGAIPPGFPGGGGGIGGGGTGGVGGGGAGLPEWVFCS